VTWESLAERPAPGWYQDAKLGIMIHWGPYSVPAWAPLTGEYARVIAEQGWEHWFAHNPYAEWYENSMLIPGSPTHQHHRASLGRLTRYDVFARAFRQGLREWNPGALIESIAGSGARYVVAAAKHHDGFLLWPARRRNPRKRGWQATRDVIGELASGARDWGLRFGLYYSSGIDWTFGGAPIRSLPDLISAMPRSRGYAAYVDAHWRELIARYAPSILWNDFGSPRGEDLLDLFRSFYAAVPDGLVNDRFGQSDQGEAAGLRRRIAAAVGRLISPRSRDKPSLGRGALRVRHADFHASEYDASTPTAAGPWECVRGLGFSFGYNEAETSEHLLSVSSLVRLLVDVVAHGGNLLLGVGPMADGSFSEAQRARLAGLGEWMKLNREAIFGSRPWGERAGATADGIEVRYTSRGMTTYAILLGTPAGRTIVLPSLRLLPCTGLRILGSIGYTAWFQEGKDVHIRLTEPLRESPAHVISITPQPRGV
jgi:alpha-L-fucosidase